MFSARASSFLQHLQRISFSFCISAFPIFNGFVKIRTPREAGGRWLYASMLCVAGTAGVLAPTVSPSSLFKDNG